MITEGLQVSLLFQVDSSQPAYLAPDVRHVRHKDTHCAECIQSDWDSIYAAEWVITGHRQLCSQQQPLEPVSISLSAQCLALHFPNPDWQKCIQWFTQSELFYKPPRLCVCIPHPPPTPAQSRYRKSIYFKQKFSNVRIVTQQINAHFYSQRHYSVISLQINVTKREKIWMEAL